MRVGAVYKRAFETAAGLSFVFNASKGFVSLSDVAIS